MHCISGENTEVQRNSSAIQHKYNVEILKFFSCSTGLVCLRGRVMRSLRRPGGVEGGLARDEGLRRK